MRNTSHDIRLRDMETDKTKKKNSLRITQRAMKRTMLGITLRDRKRSTWIGEKTKVKDIIQVVKQQMEVGRTCS